MEFIIGLYLVGYFISVGIAFSFREKSESWLSTLNVAIIFSLLSWVNIGMAIGDFCKQYILDEEKTETNEQHPLP
jgi:hypothetical protein